MVVRNTIIGDRAASLHTDEWITDNSAITFYFDCYALIGSTYDNQETLAAIHTSGVPDDWESTVTWTVITTFSNTVTYTSTL